MILPDFLAVLGIPAAALGPIEGIADAARYAGPLLLTVLPVFAGFLLAAALIARLLTRVLRLPMDSGRTLAFSLGTRNSFVVPPFALALPAD